VVGVVVGDKDGVNLMCLDPHGQKLARRTIAAVDEVISAPVSDQVGRIGSTDARSGATFGAQQDKRVLNRW